MDSQDESFVSLMADELNREISSAKNRLKDLQYRQSLFDDAYRRGREWVVARDAEVAMQFTYFVKCEVQTHLTDHMALATWTRVGWDFIMGSFGGTHGQILVWSQPKSK